jgi:replicative DNA helicase
MDLRFDGKVIPECVEKIRPEFFFVPAHRTLYIELCDVWELSSPIDLITFTQRLREKKILESVGGVADVTKLAANYVPTAANVAYYLDIVRDMYVRRQIIENAANDARRAYDANPNADMCTVLDEISSRAASLRSLHGRNGARISFRSPSEILAMPRNSKANFFGDHLLGIGLSLVLAGIGGLGKSRLLL